MTARFLDDKEYIRLLKTIRSAAQENGGKLDYQELKAFFTDITLSPGQTEKLWSFLDMNAIMILHIDEFDSLFASVPESGSPMEENPAADAHKPESAARRQDVSNVQLHSTAIGTELLRRAATEAGITLEEDYLERAGMDTARKLASRLRPNEMYALYLLWKLDGSTHSPAEVAEATEIPSNTFTEIETRAKNCTPALPGQKKGFLARLFGR